MNAERYFIEVAYVGTAYGGFQVQENADTIQGQLEKALNTFFRQKIELTGSSRTDAGVHSLQNYFHLDTDLFSTFPIAKTIYHLNAILPADIVIKSIVKTKMEAHCRFDAVSRFYIYTIATTKNPFSTATSYYFPMRLDLPLMHRAAEFIKGQSNFESFCKKNTQVSNYECKILTSEWIVYDDRMEYRVEANRFLRGMVKAMVATMLKLGRGKMDFQDFVELFDNPAIAKADFSVPSQGLCLHQVKFPAEIFHVK